MKELTYKDWQRNPTPRMMLVWNDAAENKEKITVAYVLKNGCTYRVLSIVDEDSAFETFKHCAEIEKKRRMTNQELAWWVREKPTREWKYMNCVTVYGNHGDEDKCETEEVLNNIRIREDGGGWREPLVEE